MLHTLTLLTAGYALGAGIQWITEDPMGDGAYVFHYLAGIILGICLVVLLVRGW